MTGMPNLDETNRRLLLELQKNARRSNRELARTLRIADSTCLERVRSLQQSRGIAGYAAEVDLEAVESFRHFGLPLPEVLDVFVVTVTSDFQVLVAVQDPQRLEDFVLDRIAQYPSVADVHASLVYEHLRRQPVEILESTPSRRKPTPWIGS